MNRVPCNENRFFPVRIDLQPYSVWVYSVQKEKDIRTEKTILFSPTYFRVYFSVHLHLHIFYKFSILALFVKGLVIVHFFYIKRPINVESHMHKVTTKFTQIVALAIILF